MPTPNEKACHFASNNITLLPMIYRVHIEVPNLNQYKTDAAFDNFNQEKYDLYAEKFAKDIADFLSDRYGEKITCRYEA